MRDSAGLHFDRGPAVDRVFAHFQRQKWAIGSTVNYRAFKYPRKSRWRRSKISLGRTFARTLKIMQDIVIDHGKGKAVIPQAFK